MSIFDGPDGLTRFYAEIKKMAGIAPVDELYSTMSFSMRTFKPSPQESVKGYVDRESMVWEEVQEAIAQMDQKEDATTIEPVHDHLRDMLLLGRSHIQPRAYPLIFKANEHGTPYNTIKIAMLQSYR